MKTADEIKEWLRKQDWFGAFVKNIEEHYHNDDRLSDIINGEHGRTTILEAFPWRDTEEGHDFWRNIEKQYLEWYDGNNIRERFSVDIKFEPDSKEPYQRKLYVSIENTAYGLPALSIDELSMVGEYINKYLEGIKNGRSL